LEKKWRCHLNSVEWRRGGIRRLFLRINYIAPRNQFTKEREKNNEFLVVLRIRIRIGSGFNGVLGSGSGFT
jgi:hypothetical protein